MIPQINNTPGQNPLENQYEYESAPHDNPNKVVVNGYFLDLRQISLISDLQDSPNGPLFILIIDGVEREILYKEGEEQQATDEHNELKIKWFDIY